MKTMFGEILKYILYSYEQVLTLHNMSYIQTLNSIIGMPSKRNPMQWRGVEEWTVEKEMM